MQKKRIEVYTGQYADGTWFASSSDIPWLAAESDSCNSVMFEINQLAIALERHGGQAVAFPLTWRTAAEA